MAEKTKKERVVSPGTKLNNFLKQRNKMEKALKVCAAIEGFSDVVSRIQIEIGKVSTAIEDVAKSLVPSGSAGSVPVKKK